MEVEDQVLDEFENEFEDELDDFIEEPAVIDNTYLDDLAYTTIEMFFKERKFHCGGPIPKNSLFSQNNIALVRDSDFCKGVDAIYKIINNDENRAKSKRLDVDFVLELINEVNNFRVIKEFQSGMVLLYLKYCKGYSIPSNVGQAIRWTNE